MKKIIVFMILLLFISFVEDGLSPLINLNQERQNKYSIGTNSLQFYGSANSSIYIIGIYSPYKIYLDDFSFIIKGTVKGNGSNGRCDAYFILNETAIEFTRVFYAYTYMKGSKYLHFKLGPLNFTCDDRILWNTSFSNATLHWGRWRNVSLPAGKWYLVITIFWDDKIKPDEIHIYAWVNFSSRCKDVQISTAEGGKIYALWYGKFDSNLIIYYPPFLSIMINGKASFYINNTLIYFFPLFPISKGVGKIKWVYPNGEIDKSVVFNWHGFRLSKYDFCCGVGGPGEYKLTLSYWDRMSLDLKNIGINSRWIDANPVCFAALDVKLPEFE